MSELIKGAIPGGLGRIDRSATTPSKERGSGVAKDSAFTDLLQRSSQQPSDQPDRVGKEGVAATGPNLKFSHHAVERMQQRGVSFSGEALARLAGAIDKAASKGAQETLVLTDDSALIVSVPNRTVITVLDKMGLKDRVFTNVDSTVVL